MKKKEPKRCGHCGKQFIPFQYKSRYCSRKCTNNHLKFRHKSLLGKYQKDCEYKLLTYKQIKIHRDLYITYHVLVRHNENPLVMLTPRAIEL